MRREASRKELQKGVSEERERARRKGKGRELGKGGREEEGDLVAEQPSDCEEEREEG